MIVLVSGLFALSGAIIGQVLNNYLTTKREDKKYNKETYQKLYFPLLIDLYAILDISLAFKEDEIKEHVDVEGYWRNVVNHINLNLKYGTARLVSSYQDFFATQYNEDNRGGGLDEYEKRLILAITVLDDLHDLVVNNNILDDISIKKVNEYRTVYFIWYSLSSRILNPETVERVMSYHWILDKDKFTANFYESTKRRFNLADSEYFANVFKEVLYPVVKLRCDDMFNVFMNIFKDDYDAMK